MSVGVVDSTNYLEALSFSVKQNEEKSAAYFLYQTELWLQFLNACNESKWTSNAKSQMSHRLWTQDELSRV